MLVRFLFSANKKTDESGFSLVTVMVVMGVAGVLAFSLISTTQNSMKMQNNTKIGADLDHYTGLVALQMADPNSCPSIVGAGNTLSAALSGQTAATLSNLPPNPAGVQYTSAVIQNAASTPVVAGATSVQAQLILTFQKTQQNFTGSPVVTRTIPFIATTNAFDAALDPTTITGCYGMNSNANSQQQACASIGGTWSNQMCTPSSSLSCTALGGTYTAGATPPCSGAIFPVGGNAPVYTSSTQTAPVQTFTYGSVPQAPASTPPTPQYLCICPSPVTQNSDGCTVSGNASGKCMQMALCNSSRTTVCGTDTGCVDGQAITWSCVKFPYGN